MTSRSLLKLRMQHVQVNVQMLLLMLACVKWQSQVYVLRVP